MARTLSLLAHLPRFEDDGVTHRRDCECVRCDAGFRPTEQERATARLRFEAARAREDAARVLARRRERARLKRAALALELEADAKAVDERLSSLRAARDRVAHDGRLAMLERLRRAGVPLAEALASVESLAWAQQGSNLRPED
jgi:hypothetical protein